MPVRGRQRNGNSGSDDDDQKSHQPQLKFRAKLTCKEDFDHLVTSLLDFCFGSGDAYEAMLEQGN